MKRLIYVVVVLSVCVGLLGITGFAQEQKQKRTPEEQFARMDKNADKKLTPEEFVGTRTAEKADKAKDQFKKLDKNTDGSLTLEEFLAGQKKAN